jgi:S1-C subfamily serine protease
VAGLETGMVIVEVEGQKVSSVAEFTEAMQEHQDGSDDGILMLVRTANGSRFVVLKP